MMIILNKKFRIDLNKFQLEYVYKFKCLDHHVR